MLIFAKFNYYLTQLEIIKRDQQRQQGRTEGRKETIEII